MVYKNGFKEYCILGCVCAVSYGLIMGAVMQSVVLGLLTGVLFGVLYTVCIVIFSGSLEKKSASTRAMIASSRRILCEGPANHKKGLNAIGGWLFLTEDALAFYPHKVNIGGQNILVYLNDIQYLDQKGSQLLVTTRYGQLTFIVNKAPKWRDHVLGTLQQRSGYGYGYGRY